MSVVSNFKVLLQFWIDGKMTHPTIGDAQKLAADALEIIKSLEARAFDAQEIADLRHLISIAVWIRSEQVIRPKVLTWLEAHDSVKYQTMPKVELNTHLLNIVQCNADLERGKEWWERMSLALEQQKFTGNHSWSAL